MVDTTQILLISVVTILTIILAIIGIHIVFILQEMRKMLEKMNKMLDDAGVITGGVSKSFSGMSGVMAGFKTGLSLMNVFSKKKEEKDE